ncbi:hypothetical protein ACET3Z_016032 [Daucus carota]
MTTRVAKSSKESSKPPKCKNNSKITKKEKRCKGTNRSKEVQITRSKELQTALSTSLLQRLYGTCKDVFRSEGVADLHLSDVQALAHILDSMVPEDVGLCPEIKFFNPAAAFEGVPRVGYTSIYECKKFSLCIFFLPTNAVIPLHNHPGMTVFSKLLIGTMHVKAYDWVDQAESEDLSAPPSKFRLAKLKANGILSAPCDTSVLYPTSGGNIHEFRAVTPCAIVDVIGPPYSLEEGRDSTYYKDIPYSALLKARKGRLIDEEEAESYGWLEEIEMPDEAVMYGVHYMGPEIIESAP